MWQERFRKDLIGLRLRGSKKWMNRFLRFFKFGCTRFLPLGCVSFKPECSSWLLWSTVPEASSSGQSPVIKDLVINMSLGYPAEVAMPSPCLNTAASFFHNSLEWNLGDRTMWHFWGHWGITKNQMVTKYDPIDHRATSLSMLILPWKVVAFQQLLPEKSPGVFR